MALESKNNDDSSGSGTSLAGMLEKPWLFVWTLRVLIVTLFIDLALVWSGMKSLLNRGLTTALLFEPGIVLLAVCAFGIYVCILAPVTLQILKSLRPFLPDTISYRAPEYSRGYIRAYQVRERAMMTENQFWLAEYEKHEKRCSTGQQSAYTAALLLWTVLVLAAAEVCLSLRGSSDASLLVPALFGLSIGLERLALVVLAMLAAIWSIVVLLDLSTDDDPMYCPPYAAEEYRKLREAEQQRLDFEESLRREVRESKARDQEW